MRSWPTALACAMVAALTAPAAASPADADGPSPDAPPETAQFAFLIGDWDCTVRQMKPDGGGYTEGRARWTGYWILGGFAIQDDWESAAPGGGVFRGTNIRSFNTQTGKWDNRWLPASTLQWKSFVATRKADTMVMIGGEDRDAAGRPYVDRNVFSDIGKDSFKWRKDRSFDGGATWFQGVAFIEARRKGTAP
jgi:hypothetical protein